jgi:[acyl-carrier-protein] S-malonyltransferase
MGAELSARWPPAARRFAEASEILGYDLLRLCTDGSEEELSETRVAQPALYVAGFSTWEVLAAEGVEAAFMAGHSLGEYTACAAAGAVSFADGLRAVKRRGELMSEAARSRPGGMLAVLGAGAADLAAWVAKAGETGPVVIANENAPGQVVLSGALEALKAVEAAANGSSGVKMVRLKVGGAFHSPLMREAAEAMTSVLSGIRFADPAVPVVGNTVASVLDTAGKVREELCAQLANPVRWEACVRRLKALGVDRVVESGPGRVLCGLVRRIDRQIEAFFTAVPKDIDEAVSSLKGGIHGKV